MNNNMVLSNNGQFDEQMDGIMDVVMKKERKDFIDYDEGTALSFGMSKMENFNSVISYYNIIYQLPNKTN